MKPSSRPVREIFWCLVNGTTSVPGIVEHTGTPRRTVEKVLRELHIQANHNGCYLVDQQLAGILRDNATAPNGLRIKHAWEARAHELAEQMTQVIESGPAPNRSLDHVQATPLTAARRALYLQSAYDLERIKVVFIGDHDLTSVAVSMISPRTEIGVVDVDESLLQHLAELNLRGTNPTTLRFSDLRSELPAEFSQRYDVFVTDPPYSPEGVALFLARGLQSLQSLVTGRGIMVYGYAQHMPLLGHKVQREVLRLGFTVTELLPKFNAYHGAQAIGSRSDLYVLQPTSRSKKARERVTSTAIYTRGHASQESEASPLESIARHIATRAGGVRGPVIDLRRQPDSALFSTLLHHRTDSYVYAVVRSSHPDVASEVGQRALQGDYFYKWVLKTLRNQPAPGVTIVEGRPTTNPSIVSEFLNDVTFEEAALSARSDQIKIPSPDDLVDAINSAHPSLDISLSTPLRNLGRSQLRWVTSIVAQHA